MAYKTFFTEDALADLEIILDYIRAENPAAAERFGTALLNHIEFIGELSSRRCVCARSPGRPQAPPLSGARLLPPQGK